MGLNRDGFYTTKDIREYDALFNIIYGERAPGKSFACKQEALEQAFNEHKATLALIKRNDVDIKIDKVEGYFMDRDANAVEKATKGMWEYVKVYRSKLYFARDEVDDEGHIETVRSDYSIGNYFAINQAKHYKSTGYPDIKTILVEEFITDEGYLRDEPTKLMHLLSTILRKDDKGVKVYLIGNTLSRVCPYFAEWGLTRIKRQKVGTIDTYEMQTDAGPVKVAVEYCPPSPHKSKLFFGRAARSIQGGAWQTGEFPRLQGSLEDYEEVYRLCYISIDEFKFNIVLLVHNELGNLTTFIYPTSENRSLPDRVLTGAYSLDNLWTPQLNSNNPAEVKIAECFALNKVVYSDNQCGQDFADSIKAEKTHPLSLYHTT